MKKKQIAILGSTGSIGTQALEVIAEHADLYEVYCLTANNKVELLAQQAHQFKPAAIVIANEQRYDELKSLMSDLPDVKVYAGRQALDEIVEAQPIDMVLTAMVGFAGLSPTIHAIKAKKAIALANKETLVVAGELILQLAQEYHTPILPVDSEHSAIFQSLVGEDDNPIEKILLTASGGPFRLKTMEEIAHVTKADALRHPTWDMGAKITIDSASMMNKGFEVIEAKWLFGVEANKIQVLVHPQSIVHSAVQFHDGAVKAQLGVPDMRLPIQYAFSFPSSRRAVSSSSSPTSRSSVASPSPSRPSTRVATCRALSMPPTRLSTAPSSKTVAVSSRWQTSLPKPCSAPRSVATPTMTSTSRPTPKPAASPRSCSNRKQFEITKYRNNEVP